MLPLPCCGGCRANHSKVPAVCLARLRSSCAPEQQQRGPSVCRGITESHPNRPPSWIGLKPPPQKKNIYIYIHDEKKDGTIQNQIPIRWHSGMSKKTALFERGPKLSWVIYLVCVKARWKKTSKNRTYWMINLAQLKRRWRNCQQYSIKIPMLTICLMISH